MDAYVLVDYDNLDDLAKKSGLPTLARRLESAVRLNTTGVQDVHIRLYGGWYDAKGLTNSGTILTQEIGKHFPIVIAGASKTIGRINCEIASSLVLARGDIFLHTMRERRGMRSFLKTSRPMHCANPSACSTALVAQWSRAKCPEPACKVTNREAFYYYEQKLVDTLLCADLIGLAVQAPSTPVFVVSDDDDMAPGVVLAARLGGQVWQVRRAPTGRLYDGILQQNKVQILTL